MHVVHFTATFKHWPLMMFSCGHTEFCDIIFDVSLESSSLPNDVLPLPGVWADLQHWQLPPDPLLPNPGTGGEYSGLRVHTFTDKFPLTF